MTFTTPSKVTPRHLDRLAIVYVRQSTLTQLHDHQESTHLQYGLQDTAVRLGWPPDRVLVIDDDQGKSGRSTEQRLGFQRLVAEVGLHHVGLILGLEMSRLARSNRDWHQLLEICALFGTLIADQDGLYDPAQYNDRLLLGLKGTMSEAELHVLKQRLHQGKLNKARRGEIIQNPPIGYVKRPDGRLDFDPDEQAQDVVRLVFRKFDELGTLYAVLSYLIKHQVQIPVRSRLRDTRGALTWQPPNRMTLQNMLRNPTYAGTYVYGRRQQGPNPSHPARPRSGRKVMPLDEVHVLLHDHHPAYLTWAAYLQHQRTLQENQPSPTTRGAARTGAALLSGLVVCARCGRHLVTRYPRSGAATYVCDRAYGDYGQPRCQAVSAVTVDVWVTQQVLRALEPTSLALSLAAVADLERDRAALTRMWHQRLERAQYEADRAGRQFAQVEPENRLVARTLERAWEARLQEVRTVQEAFERFEVTQPRTLTAQEHEEILRLAHDLPALWMADTTTAQDRKRVARTIIDRVMIDVQGISEQVVVIVYWVGGATSSATLQRPVRHLSQLTYFPRLCTEVVAWQAAGARPREIAARLNAQGWLPAKRTASWSGEAVRKLLHTLEGPYASS